MTSGSLLSSKWRESSAKPISSRNRLARITHSCCMCSARPPRPGAELEAGEAELVDDDGGEPGQRHLQRVVVEEGDAQQRQREQDEIDGNAEEVERLGRWSGRRGQRRSTQDEKKRGNDDNAADARARRRLTPTFEADDARFMACSPYRSRTGRREIAANSSEPRLNPPLANGAKLAALKLCGNLWRRARRRRRPARSTALPILQQR